VSLSASRNVPLFAQGNWMKQYRRVLFAVVVLSVLGLAAVEGVRRYASTQLVGGLAELYQGKVEADFARAGWRDATLEGVRFFDADGQHVVLTVERLRMGLTLWELVAGKTTPEYLELDSPRVTVRFDQQSRLLTKLPPAGFTGGTFPARIDVSNGSLVIDQQGVGATTIDGASAQVTSENLELTLNGKLANSRWGSWTLNGRTNSQFSEGLIEGATDDLAVSPEWLRQLPLVPPTLWEQITLEGPVSAKFALQLKPSPELPHLHADLKTANATITLPALGVQMERASGSVTIDDTAVANRNVRGSVYGGKADIAGDLDLAKDPLAVAMDVRVEGVELAQLPKEWAAPEETTGHVSGRATLNVALTKEGNVRATGEGQAKVDDVVLAGVPVEPIIIDLRGGEDFPAQGGAPKADGQITFDLHLRDAPVQQLLTRVRKFVDLEPPDIEGTVSTDLHVAVPLSTINDPATYQVSGDVRSPRLEWQSLRLEELSSDVEYSKGTLRLTDVSATTSEGQRQQRGSISGSATVGIAPLTAINLELTATDVPLGLLHDFVEQEPPPEGLISIKLRGEVPVQVLAAWNVSGDVSMPQVVMGQYEARDVEATFASQDGRLKISDAKATAFEAEATAQAEIELQEPYGFRISFDVPSLDVGPVVEIAAVELPADVAGQLQTSGTASGSLQPFKWTAQGDATLTDVAIDKWAIDKATFQWQADPEQLKLSNAEAKVLGGDVAAELTMPLAGEAPWKVAGELHNIDVEQLRGVLSNTAPAIQGILNGKFEVTATSPQDGTGSWQLQSGAVQVNGIKATRVQIEGTLAKGAITYDASAHVMAGDVSLTGETKLAENLRETNAGGGKLSINDLSLAHVGDLLGPNVDLPLTGLVDLELEFAQTKLDELPSGKGRLTLTDVRWDRNDLIREAVSEVTLKDGRLNLPDVYARIGGGSVEASVSLDLLRNFDGQFAVALHRVPSSVLARFWPDLAENFKGDIDAQFHGTLGSRIAGDGAIGATNAQVAGVTVTTMRLPVQFLYSRTTGRGEMRVEGATFQAGHGRGTGTATVTWDRDVSLSGKLQMKDVELQSLAPTASGLQGIGSGRVSGHAEFAADRFRSLDDLSASFDMKFSQTQAGQVPVFGSLSHVILPNVPSSASFHQGEVRGRLSNGVARIRQFTLTGDDARVLADGTVTLGGRLNLNVIAMNGSPPTGGLIRRVALGFLAAETIPLTLLTRANTALQDQIVYLRVGGTLRNPSVQVRAAPQLGYEALRFFVTGAAGGVR
jgi:hypothetical protein